MSINICLWCLTPLSTIFQYIVAVSFIDGGNRRKLPACRKSMTNYQIILYRVHLPMNGVRTHNFRRDRH